MASWTSYPATEMTLIRAILINELRKTVLRNRYAARLGWYPFTSPTVINSRTYIRAIYFTELHDAMTPYLGALNWSVGSPPSPSRPIKRPRHQRPAHLV